MPQPVLTEEEIQDIKRMRERAGDFIQLFLRTNNFELDDAEVKAHVDLRGR